MDDQALLEPGLRRVTDEEEDVDKADEADLAWPPLPVDQDLPGVDITSDKRSVSHLVPPTLGDEARSYSLVTLQAFVLDRSVKQLENSMVRRHSDTLGR